MASIHQLSAKTAHTLSIGQVVTSVFSVVKELLENALDAGATSVDVRLDDFGLEKIEVRDNGTGLTPEDTAVMGQAHFTSKIQQLDDLGSLSSFGFRGEALSAVCASCEVSVATRSAAEEVGRLVTLDAGGSITSQKPVARAQGTTVTAASLFARQPVRRQLYSGVRRRRDDLKAVEALLAATAVSRPPLRLALHHNGNQLLNKAPCDSARSAAVQVLKSEAARLLVPLSLGDDLIRIEALLPAHDASPKITGRSTGDQCFIIVNGRVVSYRAVEKVLRRLYSARHGLTPARVPVCVVQISVPASQLDVNLEPNKTRLMVLCEEKLLAMLESGVAELYRTAEPVQPDCPTPLTGTGDGPAIREAEGDRTSTLGTDGIEPPTSGVACCGDAAPTTPSNTVLGSAPAGDRGQGTVTSLEAEPGPPAAGGDVSAESLFGENFLGVSPNDDSSSEPASPGLKPRQQEAAALRPAAGDRPGPHGPPPGPHDLPPDPRGPPPDPWSTGRLLDSQGERIQPTSLVTSLAGRQAQPFIPQAADSATSVGSVPHAAASATGDSSVPQTADSAAATSSVPQTTDSTAAASSVPPRQAASVAGNGTDPATLVSAAASAAAAGDSGDAGRPAAAAAAAEEERAGPPPAKRARPNGAPSELEYEPVASQVVRRPADAFYYYCRDMRRKYLSLDPSMDVSELSSALADGWKAALPSVRRQFEEMARQDERRYREDVRKAKLSGAIQTPQKTITDFWPVTTQLCRLVAPLTPEARARRPRRAAAKLSVSGLREQVAALESAAAVSDAAGSCPSVVGPLESHQAWIVLRTPHLLLVNPLRLSETTSFARLMASYRFPCRPLPVALVLTSAELGAAQYSTLCRLPRDGSRVTDERLLANGFCVEMAEPAVRVTAILDCINCYGVGDLSELLSKIGSGADSVARCRPARVVSWLQAEAVRISQGGGAQMSAEEVAALVSDAQDLDAVCFHGRPLAAPLYRLDT